MNETVRPCLKKREERRGERDIQENRGELKERWEEGGKTLFLITVLEIPAYDY